MSAGTAYSKRYGGGFADLPATTSAIDQTFLNAVEAALLQLIGSAPTVDGQVAQWDFANTRFGPALLLNKNVDPAAAIASSKIDFTGGNALTNAAIAGAAAIARSKLDFGSGLVNADISATAAITTSKLAAPSDATVAVLGDLTTGRKIYRKATAKTVNTSVAATDLLNGEITVAANILGATGALRISAWGDWKQNSGGTAAPPRWQLLLGGTTVFDTGTSSTVVTNSATRFAWKLDFIIHNQSASFQTAVVTGMIQMSTTTAGSTLFTTGEGTYATYLNSSAGMGNLVGFNTVAKDTTGALALVLNVINGSASASYETVLQGALVEIL
jgi:hypothetical protein